MCCVYTLYYIRQPYEHPNGFLRWAVLRTIKSNFTFIIVPILYGRNSVQHNWSTWSTIYPAPADIYIVSRKRVAMRTTSGARAFYIEFGFHYDSRLQSKNDLTVDGDSVKSIWNLRSWLTYTSMHAHLSWSIRDSRRVISFRKSHSSYTIILIIYYII